MAVLALTAVVTAAEVSYKNDFFDVRFDTRGAVIKNLIHKGENWNGSCASGSSFGDMRVGCATGAKSQEHENFEKNDFAIKEWKVMGRNTVHITFSACGTVFQNIRLEKTYKFNHYRPNELVVEYEFKNTGSKPQNLFAGIRTFFRRSGKNNVYYQPRTTGDAALVQSKHMEFSKLPPRRFMAVAAEDKSGLLMAFPADSVTGFMNWFLKEGFPTQEFFSDERPIQPGQSRKIAVTMTFTKDVHALRSSSAMKTVKVKGTIPPQVEQLAREEDPSYSVRTVKAADPKDRNFVDISFNRQFNDSWRAVKLPDNVKMGKIAVFQLENGVPSFDRPVKYALKGKELLLFVPGAAPDQSPWRSRMVNGVFQQTFSGTPAVWPVALSCRIYFDREGGQLAAAPAPAGGELYLNGGFETPDKKNPKAPLYSVYVANPHRKTDWKQSGGINNSRCLEGGSAVFSFFPEARRTYELSIALKNAGGGGRMWLYLNFYDAEGKMLPKARKLLFCSDNAFDWQTVKKSFIAPVEAVMGEITVSRGRRNGCSIFIDDFSVKAAPLSCVKLSAKEMAKQELLKQWDIPVDTLESFSTDAVKVYKPWFVPSEKKIDLLLMTCETRVGRLFGEKRSIAEIAKRLPANVTCIPVIRQVVSSTGSYGVWVMTFRKNLAAYTAERLKEIKKAPKVVVVTGFQENLHDKDLFSVWEKWQKAGTHFFFFNCRPPKALQGKWISAPVKSVVPEMRSIVKGDAMISWYKKGNSYVAVSFHSVKNNPVVEEKDMATAVYQKNVSGRDFMWWEYSYLFDMQALRFLSGIRPQVKLLSGSEKALEVAVEKPFKGSAEVVVRSYFRDVKNTFVLPLSLEKGKQSIKLPAFTLPGGRFTAEVRILDSKKMCVDAGAFRIDRAETVPVTLQFANAERIYPKGKNVDFKVLLKNAPAGAVLDVEIEDIFKRVIAKRSVKAAPVNAFSIALPEPRTLLNNIFVRVSAKGKLLAETMAEFSSPMGKPDFTEYLGMNWGNVTPVKRDMGISAGTLGGLHWPNTPVYIRGHRLINVDPSPMGMYEYSKTSRLYRSDRKSHPVRTPCFSDPAFHKANRERIAKYASEGRYRYYDVQNYWSGDEQYLGASVCYSPHCLKLFRAYLKKQYSSIEALNKEWNTSFKSFDTVVPRQQEELKDKNNLSPWLDHKLFMAQVYAKGQFGFFADELAKHASAVKFGPSGTANPGLGYDWYQMMKYCKLLSYYSGIQVKLIHDFGGKEIRAGKWGGYCHAHIDAEPYIYDPMWEGMIRGANMAAVWPPIMFNGDGVPLRNFFHVSRSLKELQSGIAKMWLSADRKPEIAILYSQSSLLTSMNVLGASQWQNSQSSWVKLLEDLKYDCRFISYEELELKGVPAEYKVLILPCTLSLSEKESAALEKFVQRGGTLIADIAPGRFDGHGKRMANPVLDKFFPANAGEIKPFLKEYAPLKGKFFAGEKDLGINTVKKYGKGKAVLLNLIVGQYHFIKLGGTGGEISKSVSGDAGLQYALRTLVDGFLKEAAVRRDVRVLNAKGADFPCMAVMRFDNGNKVLALHQTGGEGERFNFKAAVPVTVKLAAKGHVYDVRKGKYLGFTDTFKSSMLPAWSQIYSIQQKKVSAVQLKAPASVTRGEVVKVTMNASGAAGAQVFHLEVLDPAGKEEKLITKNLYAANGQTDTAFQIPFNAAKGTWRIAVTHVNTGLKAEWKLIVK